MVLVIVEHELLGVAAILLSTDVGCEFDLLAFDEFLNRKSSFSLSMRANPLHTIRRKNWWCAESSFRFSLSLRFQV